MCKRNEGSKRYVLYMLLPSDCSMTCVHALYSIVCCCKGPGMWPGSLKWRHFQMQRLDAGSLLPGFSGPLLLGFQFWLWDCYSTFFLSHPEILGNLVFRSGQKSYWKAMLRNLQKWSRDSNSWSGTTFHFIKNCGLRMTEVGHNGFNVVSVCVV